MNRRDFLLGITLVPLAAEGMLLSPADAAEQAPSPHVVAAARLLTGRPSLPAEVIGRARDFQSALDPSFAPRLERLVQTLATESAGIGAGNGTGSGTTSSAAAIALREQAIKQLGKADLATAVELVGPLYLGYTGQPSTVKSVDTARFVSFLDALMYEPTADNLTRPSYARGGPNYWDETPHGLTAPPMPENIAEWGAKSPPAAPAYAVPDQRYVVMCQGHARTLAEAEAWIAAQPAHHTQGGTP